MRDRGLRRIATSCCVVALLAAAPLPAFAADRSRPVTFDITATDLTDALNQFAQQSDQQIVFKNAATAGKRTQPLRGRYTPDQALASLLRGTGLAVQESNGVLLVQEAAADPKRTGAELTPRSLSARANDTLRAGDARFEEIIVTAQKREQRLLDVPLSVTAVTAADIRDRGAHNLRDMQYSVPGLHIQEYGPGQERAQIRGISANSGLPTIGRYLDEMPINVDAEQSGASVRLIDMERVEILRGPQGTLYGEGSMGGTIKYVTASPKLDRVFGSAEAEIASKSDGQPDWRVQAMLNAPIVADKVGIRLVASHETLGGFIDSTATRAADINDSKSDMVRLKSLLQPTDRLSISLLLLNQRTAADNQQFGLRDRTAPYVLATPSVDRYTLGNLVAKYDFGPINVLSSTGYQYRTLTTSFDVSSFLAPVYALFLPPAAVTTVSLGAPQTFKIFTQEVRAASSNDGPFNWTTGGYFRISNASGQSTSVTAPVSVPLGITVNNASHYESWALFGEATYRVFEGFEILAGARFFHDERHEAKASSNFGPVLFDDNTGSFHSFNPRLNLSYRFDESGTVYFNVAKGFRSGGFNVQSAGLGLIAVPPTFAPEKLWSYEAGFKKQLLGRRLTVEAAVYYNDWTNIQTSVLAPGSAVNITANGGKASGWGTDFQVAYRPIDALTLGATVGWNDMQYHSNTQDHFEGDPMDFVPRVTGSAFGEYRYKFQTGLDGVARADFQHTDGYQITLRNFAPQIVRSDAINTINLRVGVETESWQAYLFVNNLADVSRAVQPSLGALSTNVLNNPRTVGANLRVNF